MKFRKKPVVIDAFKWTGTNVADLARWASDADLFHKKEAGRVLASNAEIQLPIDVIKLDDGRFHVVIKTKEGEMYATPGDWIICGVAGEFYPCKPDIFGATYEMA